MVFELVPLRRSWGWEIQVHPQGEPQKDYAYPLNPPLRFGNSQQLGTGYGATARETFSQEHEIRFILNSAEYKSIFKLVVDALWPYKASDQDPTARYLAAIAKARAGLIRLTVTRSDTSDGGQVVQSLSFAVALKVPSDFALASDLKSSNVVCKSVGADSIP